MEIQKGANECCAESQRLEHTSPSLLAVHFGAFRRTFSPRHCDRETFFPFQRSNVFIDQLHRLKFYPDSNFSNSFSPYERPILASYPSASIWAEPGTPDVLQCTLVGYLTYSGDADGSTDVVGAVVIVVETTVGMTVVGTIVGITVVGMTVGITVVGMTVGMTVVGMAVGITVGTGVTLGGGGGGNFVNGTFGVEITCFTYWHCT